MVLDGDKGPRFQILKARGPGKFISPRLTWLKVLKKCSILENRLLRPMFCLIFEISGLSAAFVEVSRFWAALPGAQHSDECIRPLGMTHDLYRQRSFLSVKQYFIDQRQGKSWRKGHAPKSKNISQNERYLSKPPIRSRRAWYSMEIKGQGFRF